MQKFTTHRDFVDDLGPVEFECRRVPVAGQRLETLIFALIVGGFGALVLMAGISVLVELPEEPRDRLTLAGVLAVPLVIGVFRLVIRYNNACREMLRLALHRNGLRWNRLAIHYDEIERIQPGAAPSAAATAMPTLSRLFWFFGAVTNPITYYHIKQCENASFSVRLDSGKYARLRNIQNLFVANDVDHWLQILSERNPNWFRAEDWGSL